METPGKCRWCGCTYEEPCPGSCGWANRSQTLCTACVNLDREWSHLKTARPPNMHRAFFRGYLAGSDDERAVDHGLANGRGERGFASNPYQPGGESARYWQRGFEKGLAER